MKGYIQVYVDGMRIRVALDEIKNKEAKEQIEQIIIEKLKKRKN